MQAHLAVKALPKSGCDQICGWENEALKVRLRAIPAKGEANDALILFLSKSLEIPKSRFILVRGKSARHKMFTIEGISQEDLENRIGKILTSK